MQDCPLPSLPQLTGPSQTLPLACPSPGNEKFPLYLPMVRCPHPIQNLFPGTIIHHYMDDTLVCASEKSYLDRTGNKMIKVSEKTLCLRFGKTKFNAPAHGLTSNPKSKRGPSCPSSSPSGITQRPQETCTNYVDPSVGYGLCWGSQQRTSSLCSTSFVGVRICIHHKPSRWNPKILSSKCRRLCLPTEPTVLSPACPSTSSS